MFAAILHLPRYRVDRQVFFLVPPSEMYLLQLPARRLDDVGHLQIMVEPFELDAPHVLILAGDQSADAVGAPSSGLW